MKKRNPLTQFLVGLVMLVAGGYWFMSSVTVTTGYFGLSFGNFHLSGGLVVIPFIAGIIWLFLNTDSIGAKLLTGLGLIIILGSIIMSTRFIFHSKSLYEYLLMLVLIFGGAALSLQVLLASPKEDSDRKGSTHHSAEKSYDDLEKELEELKKKRK